MGGFAPTSETLTQNAAMRKFRAGRVILETTPSGARCSWNPDRRWRKEVCAKRGITTGRQWKKFKRALRREQNGWAEARR